MSRSGDQSPAAARAEEDPGDNSAGEQHRMPHSAVAVIRRFAPERRATEGGPQLERSGTSEQWGRTVGNWFENRSAIVTGAG